MTLIANNQRECRVLDIAEWSLTTHSVYEYLRSPHSQQPSIAQGAPREQRATWSSFVEMSMGELKL